jgi:hypothetical protein
MADPKRRHASLLVAASAAVGLLAAGAPAQAAPLAPTGALNAQVNDSSDISEVAVVVRRGVAVGPRGGVYRYRGATVVRPGRPVARWARPYHWPRGGAIAAGAAIGFIAAAGAAAYASSPAPAPGMCWYYNDPYRPAHGHDNSRRRAQAFRLFHFQRACSGNDCVVLPVQQALQQVEQRCKQRECQRDGGDGQLKQRDRQIDHDISHVEINEDQDRNQDDDPGDDEPVNHVDLRRLGRPG